MRYLLIPLLALIVVFTTPLKACAQLDSTERQHYVSVGFDPLTLLSRISGSIEVSLASNWSIAAVGAIDTRDNDFRATGATISWYPIGSFDRGVQLAVTAVYTSDSAYANPSIRDYPFIPGVRRTTDVGILSGYKYTANIGLMINALLGYGIRFDRTRFADGTESGGGRAFGPMMMLNIGWSF